MACTQEGAIYGLYTGECYTWFAHSRVLYGVRVLDVCTRRVFYIVCTREGAIHRLHMACTQQGT